MTTTAWHDHLEIVRRESDGERLGFLRSLDGDRWEPLDLLGRPLGAPVSRDDARRIVDDQGLGSISRIWWVRAPLPLTSPLLDARDVDETIDWRMMVIAELTPGQALLRSYFPSPEEAGNYVRVTLPAGDVIRAEYPDDE